MQIIEVENRGVLNNLSEGRPHNGFVLETEKRNQVLVSAFAGVEDGYKPIEINANVMSHERNLVSPSSNRTPKRKKTLYLLLDEISDPQNIGAIARTAYFLGVSGLVLSAKNCAPINPIVSKTSSGASEFLEIYHTPSTVSFIRNSTKAGWTFISTLAPSEKPLRSFCQTARLSNLLDRGPCVLVLGSEGSGLRTLVKRECQVGTSIESAEGVDSVVDSLNVSAATCILISKLLDL